MDLSKMQTVLAFILISLILMMFCCLGLTALLQLAFNKIWVVEKKLDELVKRKID